MLRRGVAAALVLVVLAGAASAGDTTPLAVVMHPTRHATLTRDDVALIYLRRKRFWDDGTPIVPLNLAGGSPMRAAFTDAVLRQSERVLADYWNRQYFYGILPPATLASTEAVLRYVASDPNAIGYVPASAVDGSVAVLIRIE